NQETTVIEQIVVAGQRLPLLHSVEVLADVDVLLVNRRPIGERQFLLLYVNRGLSQEFETASVIVVEVRLHDMTNPFAVDSERVQARHHVVPRRHRDLEEIRSVAETAPRVVDQARMCSVVEKDISLRMPDQVEEVWHLDSGGAVRIERIIDRADRLLSTAMECIHLHR